jgi:hypothetical protein
VNLYRGVTAVFAVVFIGIGIALLVVAAARGGSVTGYVIGILFIALGVGRLYLLRSRPREPL